MANETHTPIPGCKPDVPFAHSSDAVNEHVKTFIKDHEASDEIPNYFYLDTEGKVTIGVGQMIPNASAARDLPMYVAQGNNQFLREARGDEKADAFQKVRSAGNANKSATAFDPSFQPEFPNLRMKDHDIQWMFEQRLREGVHTLERKFPEFRTYPPSARLALQDMEFNLGPNKLSEGKWPSLFGAVRRRDWNGAAAESQRRIVRDPVKNRKLPRNIEARQLFERATQEDQQGKKRF